MKRNNDVAKISMVETDMGFAMNDVCQKRFLSFCRAWLNRDKSYIDQLHMRGVTWSADKIFDAIEAAKTAVKNDLTAGAAAALDTLSELAAALNNDPAFAATIAAEIANRVRFDAAQVLDATQQNQARSNIGAYGAAEIGNPDADLVAAYNAAKT